MNRFNRLGAGAMATLMATTIAGCGGLGQSSLAPPGPAAGSKALGVRTAFLTAPDRRAHRAAGKSWASGAAQNSKLLYYADNLKGVVNFYSYPAGVPMGAITGFSRPAGLCTDKHGNVYVVDAIAAQITEYPHGSITPVGQLLDPNKNPIACSVDRTTGNVAVANTDASVVVYAFPGRTPTTYQTGSLEATDLSYDNAGNLFVATFFGSFLLYEELPKGALFFETDTLGLYSFVPVTVTWDNQVHGHMVLCDPFGTCYQTQAAGSQVAITGTFTINAPNQPYQSGFRFGTATKSRLIMPDGNNNAVYIFDYPAGGGPIKTIPGGYTGGAPAGSALSIAHT